MLPRLLLALLVIAAVIVTGSTLWDGWAQLRAMRQMQEAALGESLGPEQAAVTVTEFVDYRCHICRETHPVMQSLASRNPDVKIVFRHLPMAMEPSILEARLALAAAMQGKFVPVHDRLMSRDTPAEAEDIDALIADFGIDRARLETDMYGPAVTGTLRATTDAAIRLRGIPLSSFIINGRLYRYDGRTPTLAELEAAIAAARDDLTPRKRAAPAGTPAGNAAP